MNKDNKSVLFLTGSFYPSPSPNAICAKRIMDGLIEKGFSVFLVTLKNIHGQKQQEVIDGISVLRIKNYLLVQMQLFFTRKNTNKKSCFLKLTEFLLRFKGLLYIFFWPLLSPIVVWRYYKSSYDICKKNEVKVVVGVYKSLEILLACCILKKRCPEIKFFIYSLDAMSGSILPRLLFSDKIALYSIKRWERICFTKADSIYLMESHRSYYSQDRYSVYQKKIRYVDIPLVDVNYNNNIFVHDTSNSLVFTGSMGRATADPHYLIKLLRLPLLMNIPLKFNIYGNISMEIENDIRESGLLNDKIFLLGNVPHSEIKDIQNNATAFINFGNSYSCAIPCKIFEYISTQRPIISFYKIDEDAGIPYLKKYPNILLIKEDESLLEENANRLKLFLEKNIGVNGAFDLGDVYYANTPENMVKEILREF